MLGKVFEGISPKRVIMYSVLFAIISPLFVMGLGRWSHIAYRLFLYGWGRG